MKKLEIGAIYKHYKGTKVKVIAEGLHSESLELMVVYMHLEDGATWIRPKEMFLGNVLLNRVEVERFEKVDGEILIKPNAN